MAERFKTTVQQIAERSRKDNDKDGATREYRVKVRARVPLSNAGETTTVRVKGASNRREITKDLSKEGYEVVKIESRKQGGWFFW